MQAGNTFTLKDKSVDSHLWVIVSDPAVDEERVLFLSMTSYDVTKEKFCLTSETTHSSRTGPASPTISQRSPP